MTRPQKQHSLPIVLILLLIAVSGPLGLWLLQKEPSRSIDLKTLCFNIRNGYGKDGENRWELRKALVAGVIAEQAPDIAGLQEVHHFQLEYLLEQLPDYRAVGLGRDGGTHGEYCPIFYRADRWLLIKSGTFWLSNTPDVPSAHWGNRYKRICTWAWLEDRRSRRTLMVYNTHFDHESEAARKFSARRIMETIATWSSNLPFVLMGDFNADEESVVSEYLKGRAEIGLPNPIPLVDTWRVIHPDNPESGTVSRFNGSMEPSKIDSIFTKPNDEVLSAEIIRDHREGRYPSDHYPVSASMRLK